MPANSVLQSDRFTVRLNQITTDVNEFEQALRLDQHQLAINIYEGELLHGYYDDWIFPLRRQYEAQFCLTAERYIRTLIASKFSDEAAAYVRRVLNLVPDWDIEELEFDVLLQRHTEQRYEAGSVKVTAPQQRSDQPGKPSTDFSLVPDQIPTTYGRLFGRDDEIESLIRSWSEGPHRVLTLTGTGGIGKTRLSLETIRKLRELRGEKEAIFAFVPLAPLSKANLLYDTILDALAVPRSPNVPASDTLIQALAGKEAYVVLDNCEHLLPELALQIERLISQTTGLRLLSSSRVRLEVTDEREIVVSSLAVPDVNTELQPAELLAQPGVALFVDRASRVRPDFAVTLGNANVIATLSTLLEGIPLAIELLAARAGVLSPSQMVVRFRDRFSLLQTSQRHLLPHHRSLAAAIDWSYQLLPPELARFWRLLSVFRGGFTAESAAEITNESHALHALAQLRAASLVRMEEQSGEIRFFLLESLREFGELKLTDNEHQMIAQQHAQYFLDFAKIWVPELGGSGYSFALGHLDSEIDNLRAAISWNAANSPEEHLNLVAQLWRYWEVRGVFGEGCSHLESALVLTQTKETDWVRARITALNGLGRLRFLQSDFRAALEALDESRRLSEEDGDISGHATALLYIGIVELYRSNLDISAEALRASLEKFEHLRDLANLARSLNYLGINTLCQFQVESARQLYDRAIEIARQSGDETVLSYALFSLGDSYALAGNQYHLAKPFFIESLQLVGSRSDRTAIAYAQWGLGYVALAEGHFQETKRLFADVLESFLNLHQKWAVAFLIGSFAHLRAQIGQFEMAVVLLGASTNMHQELDLPMPLHYKSEYERWMQPARTALTEEEFTSAFVRGLKLSFNDAISLALGTQPKN